VFSHPPIWGKRHSRYKTPDGTPSIRTPSGVFSCYPLVAISSSKDTLFWVCALLQSRLQRSGAKGFLRATKGVLGAMSFVLLAVLGSAIAVSAVLVMYTLVHRWL
jgi:hypothetical protein